MGFTHVLFRRVFFNFQIFEDFSDLSDDSVLIYFVVREHLCNFSPTRFVLLPKTWTVLVNTPYALGKKWVLYCFGVEYQLGQLGCSADQLFLYLYCFVFLSFGLTTIERGLLKPPSTIVDLLQLSQFLLCVF